MAGRCAGSVDVFVVCKIIVFLCGAQSCAVLFVSGLEITGREGLAEMGPWRMVVYGMRLLPSLSANFDIVRPVYMIPVWPYQVPREWESPLHATKRMAVSRFPSPCGANRRARPACPAILAAGSIGGLCLCRLLTIVREAPDQAARGGMTDE